VPAHGDDARLLGDLDQLFGVFDAVVTGISTNTCLPARIACSPCRKCSFVGVVRITASARLMPSERSPV